MDKRARGIFNAWWRCDTKINCDL